jgi:Domain of unknown function (DUF3395)/DnaJ domain
MVVDFEALHVHSIVITGLRRDGGSRQSRQAASVMDAAHEEDSLYVRLQLVPTATPAEVRAAFHRLSRRYHPDKHLAPAAKAAANDAFARIKEAYEVLSDAKFRRLYDSFGLEAARTAQAPHNELVPYADLASRFQADADAAADSSCNAGGGGKSGGAGSGDGPGFPGGRDPYFTVSNSLEPRVDATGLVAALDDGFDWVSYADKVAYAQNSSGYYAPLAILTQVALSTAATAYVTPTTTVSMQYSLMNRPRSASATSTTHAHRPSFPSVPLPSSRVGLVSAGELAVSARRLFSSARSAIEGALYVPLDPLQGMSVSGKLTRNLSDHTTAALDASSGLRERNLTLSLSATRQLDTRNSGNISWAIGANPGVAFVYRRDAYDEYIDTDARANKNSNAASSDARPDFGAGDNEDNEIASAASSEADVPRRKEIVPVSALIRACSLPLGCIVSPHVWAPIGGRLSLLLGLSDVSVGVTVRRPIGRNAPWFAPSDPSGSGGGYIKIRTQLGIAGWEVEAGGGRRYTTVDSAWNTSVAIGTHGVVLRLKLLRSGNRFQLPIVLVSTTADPRVATIAAITTSAIVSAIQILIIRPWRESAEAAERDEAKRGRASAMAQAQADAESSRKLIARAVQGSIDREMASSPSGGLIIERALYGLRHVVASAKLDDVTFAGREVEAEATEVGDCVQALVEDSRVQIISSTKGTILGFWDPTAMGDDDKAVRIWYRFRGAMHDCLVPDDEPLELPLSTHAV